MAQALLNNLNIMKNNSYVAKNKLDMQAFEKNFSKVIEEKTHNCKNDIKDRSDLEKKESKNIKSNKLTYAIQDAMQESIAEEVVDSTLENNEIISDSQITEESAQDNTNITEEDSTMEKELTPLENPAAAIMLQTQTLHKKNYTSAENDDDVQNEEILLKTKNTVLESIEKNSEIIKKESKFELAKIDLKENWRDSVKEAKSIIDDAIAEDLNIESVTASQEGEAPSGNLMQNQNPSEQSLKIMLQGDVKYEDLSMKIVSAAKSANTEINSAKIIEQITKQLEGMYNSSKVNIVLNPESLGRVALQIINSKEGLSAHFMVNNPETRDLLMKGLDGLKETLLAHGINIDNVVIKLEEGSDLKNNENNFDWSEGSRGGNKNQQENKEKGDKEQFEQTMFKLSQNN